MSAKNKKILIIIFILILTAVVYSRTLGHGFVNFDDPEFVTNNIHVKSGLNSETISWAFFKAHESSAHPMPRPLTWLSLMLDFELWGLNPAGFHLTNLLLHLAGSALLFLLFNRMTSCLWRSAFVAAVFALHPLHVESVAWVAERKDVLSVFFALLSALAYVRYTEKPGTSRYIAVFALFACALMSKAMLVTWPFVFLLLDLWPLERFKKGSTWGRLFIEKIPLFALAGFMSVFTYLAQSRALSIVDTEHYPLLSRLGFSFVAYATYIGKTVWPTGLAVFYPHPRAGTSPWKIAAAVIFITLVTVFVLKMVKKRPYLFIAWFWFLGTLVPVIGIVQTGSHAIADRYMYMPVIGLAIMAAWGAPELLAGLPNRNRYMAVAGFTVIIAFAILTYHQAGYWRSSVTLFNRAISVTTDNYRAYNNLGVSYGREGRFDLAIENFTRAIEIRPGNHEYHYNSALAYDRKGMKEKAFEEYKKTLQLKPDFVKGYLDMGLLLAGQGRHALAVQYFKQASKYEPKNPAPFYNAGLVYEHRGMNKEAAKFYSLALEASPGYEPALARQKGVGKSDKNK